MTDRKLQEKLLAALPEKQPLQPTPEVHIDDRISLERQKGFNKALSDVTKALRKVLSKEKI